jgi:electron transfer flavoprotein beta subunit
MVSSDADAGPRYRLSESDEYAIEQAIRLKEQLGKRPYITLVGIGPEAAQETIRKGLALGCDRGVQIIDSQGAVADPSQTAAVLSRFCHISSYDLILTGTTSKAFGSGRLAARLADSLGYRLASSEGGLRYLDGYVTLEEEGEPSHSVPVVALPAVVDCQLSASVHRYPLCIRPVQAGRKEILTYPVERFLTDHGDSYGWAIGK